MMITLMKMIRKKEKTYQSVLKKICGECAKDIINSIKEKQSVGEFFEEAREDSKLLKKYFNKEQIEKVVTAKIELTLTDSFIKISKIVIGELLKSRMPTKKQLERLNQSESLFIEWIKKAQQAKVD